MRRAVRGRRGRRDGGGDGSGGDGALWNVVGDVARVGGRLETVGDLLAGRGELRGVVEARAVEV